MSEVKVQYQATANPNLQRDESKNSAAFGAAARSSVNSQEQRSGPASTKRSQGAELLRSQTTFAPAVDSPSQGEDRPSMLSEIHNGKEYTKIKFQDGDGNLIDAL